MSELMSVFVLVSERHEPVRELYHDYKRALDALGRDYELMYVLDGDFPDTLKDLVSLQEAGERIRVLRLGKTFGEATALTAAYRNSRGDVIVTLPAYWQIEPSEIPEIVRALDDCDMVIARRWPRIDSTFNRIQNRVFHWLLNFVTGVGYRDLGCGVRAYRRQIADEVPLYGDQHRFLPVLADQRGFRVKEL